MNILNLIQGSDEWKAARKNYFTASEAAAMLGLDPKTKRNDLLHMKATGTEKEFSDWVQVNILDKGHEVEALARPIIETRIGQELYPVTATNEIDGLPYLASMDGLTMMEDQGFECKQWNKGLAALVRSNEVPDSHWPQLEHQMLVTDVPVIHFTVSDGTDERTISLVYESTPERREQVRNGWKRFAEDLSNYVPEVPVEVIEAEPVRDLPAITYRMDGLSLKSNLADYKKAALELVEQSKKPLESDQDFANAEAMVKVFNNAETKIQNLCEQVLGEAVEISEFIKDLKFIGETIRQARLAREKQVKARKDEIRNEIASAAKKSLADHVAALQDEIKATLPNLGIDIDGAMKGKKNRASLKDAADTKAAQGKIEADRFAGIARANAGYLESAASAFKFLFNDWRQLAFMDAMAFQAIVDQRIAEHKAREDKRLADEAAAELQPAQKAPMQPAQNVQQPVTQQKAHVPANDESIQQAGQTRLLTPVEVRAVMDFATSITSREQSQFATRLRGEVEAYLAAGVTQAAA